MRFISPAQHTHLHRFLRRGGRRASGTRRGIACAARMRPLARRHDDAQPRASPSRSATPRAGAGASRSGRAVARRSGRGSGGRGAPSGRAPGHRPSAGPPPPAPASLPPSHRLTPHARRFARVQSDGPVLARGPAPRRPWGGGVRTAPQPSPTRERPAPRPDTPAALAYRAGRSGAGWGCGRRGRGALRSPLPPATPRALSRSSFGVERDARRESSSFPRRPSPPRNHHPQSGGYSGGGGGRESE